MDNEIYAPFKKFAKAHNICLAHVSETAWCISCVKKIAFDAALHIMEKLTNRQITDCANLIGKYPYAGKSRENYGGILFETGIWHLIERLEKEASDEKGEFPYLKTPPLQDPELNINIPARIIHCPTDSSLGELNIGEGVLIGDTGIRIQHDKYELRTYNTRDGKLPKVDQMYRFQKTIGTYITSAIDSGRTKEIWERIE